jgi:hypothetical protein
MYTQCVVHRLQHNLAERCKKQIHNSKSNLEGMPGLRQDHGNKPGGQSSGGSMHSGLSPRKQACWGKVWVVKPWQW